MLGMEWDKPPAINAVYFWANQGLLRQKPGGLFEVQERLRDAAAAPKLGERPGLCGEGAC